MSGAPQTSDKLINTNNLQRKEIKMAIEWPVAPNESEMTVEVLDNTAVPANIHDASKDTTVHIEWTVPPPLNTIIGGSFRLRVYAESIGPGQEIQIGTTAVVPVVSGRTDYEADILVPGGTLTGEGAAFEGVIVSGVYRIVAVLQHLNPGANEVSGFADATIRMFREP